MTRTDWLPSGDERAMLATFLDYTRATVRAKCEGVSAEHARATPVPTSPLMTIAGLVNHLRWVEYWWFQVTFLGERDEGPWSDEDPDGEMRIAVDFPIADLLAEYESQAERYRALVAATDLDAVAAQPGHSGEPPTLRWILYHLIEETARHNGHLDLMRELLDGSTGC